MTQNATISIYWGYLFLWNYIQIITPINGNICFENQSYITRFTKYTSAQISIEPWIFSWNMFHIAIYTLVFGQQKYVHIKEINHSNIQNYQFWKSIKYKKVLKSIANCHLTDRHVWLHNEHIWTCLGVPVWWAPSTCSTSLNMSRELGPWLEWGSCVVGGAGAWGRDQFWGPMTVSSYWTDRLTETTENITFPQLCWWVVIIEVTNKVSLSTNLTWTLD